MRASIERDPGSFRDPDSWIFNAGDRILRRIPKDLVNLIGRPDVAKFLKAEVAAGRLIEGLALRNQDATAFNILFSQGRPVFVDWGSFRTPFRPDIWYALGQFQRMFSHPLLLKAARGSTPAQCFLAHLDGVPLSTVANELGSRRMWMSPSLWLDIALPCWVESRNRRRPTQSENDPALHRRPLAVRSDFQQSNLRRIRRMIDRLETKFSMPVNGRTTPWTAIMTRQRTSPSVESLPNSFRWQSQQPSSTLDAIQGITPLWPRKAVLA